MSIKVFEQSARHRGHFVRRLSVCPSVSLSCIAFAGATCLPQNTLTIIVTTCDAFSELIYLQCSYICLMTSNRNCCKLSSLHFRALQLDCLHSIETSLEIHSPQEIQNQTNLTIILGKIMKGSSTLKVTHDIWPLWLNFFLCPCLKMAGAYSVTPFRHSVLLSFLIPSFRIQFLLIFSVIHWDFQMKFGT